MTRPSAPAVHGRTRGSRSAVLAVLDQLVSAGTNFLTAFVASRLLVPDDFGAFAIGLSAATLVCCLQRGLVGEPLLVDTTYTCRRTAESDGLAAAAAVGLAAACLLAPVTLVDSSLVAGIAWFLPWLPVYLMQDYARYVHFGRRSVASALALDAVWAVVQVAALVALAVASLAGPPALLAATWGLGALAGLVVHLVGIRGDVARPDVRRWFSRTRRVGGWFSATSLTSQAQEQLLLLLVGALAGPAATATLRSMQLMFMQPVLTCSLGLNGVVLPWTADAVRTGDVRRLRTGTTVMTAAFALFGALALVTAAFAGPLLSVFFPLYAQYSGLALPTACLALAWCAAIPAGLVLKGIGDGRTLFAVFASKSALLLAVAAAVTPVYGLAGLLWAMTAVSVVHALLSVAVTRRVLRTSHAPRSSAATRTDEDDHVA